MGYVVIWKSNDRVCGLQSLQCILEKARLEVRTLSISCQLQSNFLSNYEDKTVATRTKNIKFVTLV